MKYPFTPELLADLPEELAELYRGLENKLLDEICSRLVVAKQLNEVTVNDIRALRANGIDLEDITRAIQHTTGIAQNKLDALLDDVVERNQAYYGELATLADITAPAALVRPEDVAAIRRQTWSAMRNITTSMGFLVKSPKGGLELLPPARAYQRALDNAVMQIESGGISYTQAINNAVKELAGGGLQYVNYESGKRDHIDVAARRAVFSGVSQLCDKYVDQSMEYLGTRYCEVSAHAGARDKVHDLSRPWQDHHSWQGRVYYDSEFGEPDPLGLYEELRSVTGYGEVDGLTGVNCRHRRYSFLPGISERTYTDDFLEHIDDGRGCTFEGKDFSAYEAEQEQRRIERTIRKYERLSIGYKATGQEQEEAATAVKLKALRRKYREFSEAAGLPEQWDRTAVIMS